MSATFAETRRKATGNISSWGLPLEENTNLFSFTIAEAVEDGWKFKRTIKYNNPKDGVPKPYVVAMVEGRIGALYLSKGAKKTIIKTDDGEFLGDEKLYALYETSEEGVVTGYFLGVAGDGGWDWS